MVLLPVLPRLQPVVAPLLPVPAPQQRHPHDARPSNPNDTAPPRRRPGQQSQPPRPRPAQHSPWHSAPTRHTHEQSPRDGAIPTACHCVPRHSAAHATPIPIHGFPAPAAISQRLTREHAPPQPNSRAGPRNLAVSAGRARFPAPAAQNDAQRGHRSHHSPCLPRETHVHHARTQHAPTPIPTAQN